MWYKRNNLGFVMAIKKNIVVCLLLVVGTYVYGMDKHELFLEHEQGMNFIEWKAKYLKENSKKRFQEQLKRTDFSNDLSKQEMEMIVADKMLDEKLALDKKAKK